MLSGAEGVFAENRAASGVVAAGLGPVATQALLSRRASPPLVAPLATGLSMNPVDQDIAPTVEKADAIRPVDLTQPRLHAVLQPQVRATEAAVPAMPRRFVKSSDVWPAQLSRSAI